MNYILWTISFFFGAILQTFHGEIFTSVYKLSILAREEGKLLRAFKKYIAAKTKEGKTLSFELQRLLNDIEPLVSSSCMNPSYAENPINSFHLISRFVYKWPVVYSSILCPNCEKDDDALYLNTTFAIVNSNIVRWPGEYDIKATADALLRLRVFYYFDIDALIDGRLVDERVLPLSPSQVLKIIQIAEDNNMLNEAKLWCESLLRRLPFTSHLDENINAVAVLRRLAGIYFKAGMPARAAMALQDTANIGISEVDKDYKYYKTYSNGTEDRKAIELVYDEYDGHYKQLCRTNTKTDIEQSRLYCYRSNTDIPYYKGKVEIVNLDPRIVMFHDVISETEAAHLRDEGSKTFEVSTVIQTDNYRTVADKIRVSQTAWVDDQLAIAEKASNRVGLLTGLDTQNLLLRSNAEPFQVVNYGIGGMYHPHHDYINIPLWGPINENDAYQLQGSGDRIATWMFYLNDVKAGGATVFPEVKARVPVVKGSAAFWYNLLPSGVGDNRTLHAGCPVIIGSKWIANKWIRETGQMLRRPCDLQP